MIDFFEMLNSCSPLRTIAYLVFILALTFIVFAGITDIIGKLTQPRVIEDEKDDTNLETDE